MKHATPAVKAPKTLAPATCARCGRKLKAGTPHTATILGTLGSECEQYAAQALMILHRAGLGVLATQGEIRLPTVVNPDGTVGLLTPDAARGRIAQADRIGLTLRTTYDPRAGEFVYTLAPWSARDLLNRREGVAA